MREDYWDIGVDLRKYMPEEYNGEMFHYTSTGALFNILEQKGISFWISRQDCLNDVNEGKLAEKLYHEILKKLKSENKVTQEQFDVLDALEIDNRSPFLYCSQKLNPDMRKEIFTEYEQFVCCFSKEKDSLPMWNYYAKGKRYEGYNLRVSAEEIRNELSKRKENAEDCWSNIEFDIFSVEYSPEKQEEYIRGLLLEFIELINSSDFCAEDSVLYISDAMREWNTVFKNACFAHENEVRLIIRRPKNAIEDAVCRELPEVFYRHNHEYIIPYIKAEFSKSVVKSVCFGPSILSEEEKNRQTQILRECLSRSGYEPIKTNYSTVPVRY